MSRPTCPPGTTKREILEALRDGNAITRAEMMRSVKVKDHTPGRKPDRLEITTLGRNALKHDAMPSKPGRARQAVQIYKLTKRVKHLEDQVKGLIRKMEDRA